MMPPVNRRQFLQAGAAVTATAFGFRLEAATATALGTYGYTGSSVAVITGGASFCLQGTSAATGSPAYKITYNGGAVAGTC